MRTYRIVIHRVVGVRNRIDRWSFLDVVGGNMHVHTGVEAWYHLIEKRNFSALFDLIKRIWSELLDSIKHAVFFVDSLPNVGPIVSGVALSVLSKLNVYEVWIILSFLELINTPFTLSSFHLSWISFYLLRLSEAAEAKLMIERGLGRLVILLLLCPKLGNLFLITFAKTALIRVAKSLLSPKRALFLHIDLICRKVWHLNDFI